MCTNHSGAAKCGGAAVSLIRMLPDANSANMRHFMMRMNRMSTLETLKQSRNKQDVCAAKNWVIRLKVALVTLILKLEVRLEKKSSVY